MKNSGSQRGFALVVVLAILVLMVVLIVGFLVRSMSERSAASSFKASVQARQFADTAVSLVQGQINFATSQGAGVAWASQPGMVRTFDTSGTLVRAYKLYSSGELISASVGITNGKSDDEPPAAWSADTAIWTDLNSPVEANNQKIFPIVDPSGAGENLADDSDNAVAKGFTIGTVPGATAYQPLPMPVRWLYVLKDGTLVAPTGSGTTATVAGETAQNPIVGRVGFWTDDDSCKVNVNTASEGVFWDTPRAGTNTEIALAKFQPAQKEWQRYPGHPAMTSLSTVFPAPSGYTAAQWTQEIYNLVPRVVGGGSSGGTVIASAALTPDADRLYASLDEMLFKPDRTLNGALTRTQLERARFFLTARSRAPETNLFNLPRVACWPIYRLLPSGQPDSNRTTAFDRLIAFCSTVNGKPYFFQREQAASPTNDYQIARNTDLYAYLKYLTDTAIPGFGGKFSAKYNADREQILTEIFDYIRSENLQDDVLAANMRFTPNNGIAGLGWVAPTRMSGNSTSGFGRSYTISELALGVICNAMSDDFATTGVAEDGGSNTTANPVLGGTPLGANERYIQAIMTPEFFSVMQGWVQIAPLMRMKIVGLGTLTATVSGSTFPLFPDLDAEGATVVASNATQITNWGGNPSYRLFGQGMKMPGRGNFPADSAGPYYPFIGTPVKVSAPASGGSMTINGATLNVELYSGTSGPMDNTTLLQTITVNIPANVTMPLPKVVGGTLFAANKEAWWTFSGSSGRLNLIGQNPGSSGRFFLEDYDAVRTFLPKHGDYRLIAGKALVPTGEFVVHPYANDPARRIAASLGSTDSVGWLTGGDARGTFIHNVTYPFQFGPDMPYLDPSDASTAAYWPDLTGDFDTGVSVATDGAYVNKPDEGNIRGLGTSVPYFDVAYFVTAGGTTFFSPNRQMPSAGMFGSLPTGVKAGVPWRTLLFRPQSGHFGATSPSDHLLLDLFWMPVVEPYAISDRFSTAGKINLNYQILPFTYLTRSTGLRAVLEAEKVTAIPTSSVGTYKPNIRNANWTTVAASNPDFRLAVDAKQTLSQFQARFDSGNIFKSASEICDMHIVPNGKTVADMNGSFWQTNALTGENLRERIYTTLYPRLTTKSNTFTVHFRAQSLKKLPTSAAGTWTEGRDQVTGEYRGSTTIERFIDASNSSLPDYAANPNGIPGMDTLDKFYRWRVVENRQFAP